MDLKLKMHTLLNVKENHCSKKNVHWEGRISPEEVIPALSNYHMLCLPSAFEMSPLVIQEAFAAGLPVLASDVYGNAEQIKDEINGWLFRSHDSNHLLEKLKFLIENPDKVEEARLHLPEANMFSEVASRHIELYSSITAKRKYIS